MLKVHLIIFNFSIKEYDIDNKLFITLINIF